MKRFSTDGPIHPGPPTGDDDGRRRSDLGGHQIQTPRRFVDPVVQGGQPDGRRGDRIAGHLDPERAVVVRGAPHDDALGGRDPATAAASAKAQAAPSSSAAALAAAGPEQVQGPAEQQAGLGAAEQQSTTSQHMVHRIDTGGGQSVTRIAVQVALNRPDECLGSAEGIEDLVGTGGAAADRGDRMVVAGDGQYRTVQHCRHGRAGGPAQRGAGDDQWRDQRS